MRSMSDVHLDGHLDVRHCGHVGGDDRRELCDAQDACGHGCDDPGCAVFGRGDDHHGVRYQDADALDAFHGHGACSGDVQDRDAAWCLMP